MVNFVHLNVERLRHVLLEERKVGMSNCTTREQGGKGEGRDGKMESRHGTAEHTPMLNVLAATCGHTPPSIPTKESFLNFNGWRRTSEQIVQNVHDVTLGHQNVHKVGTHEARATRDENSLLIRADKLPHERETLRCTA